jgi:hypothetical protein
VRSSTTASSPARSRFARAAPAALGVDLDADEPPTGGRHRVGEPQRRDAVGGAELEHVARPERPHEQVEQLARLGLEVAEAIEPVGLRRVEPPAALVQLAQDPADGVAHS